MIAKLGALLLIAPLLMLGSCELFQSKMANEYFLCEMDQGRTISVRVGDELIVRLESNASTGYTWEWTRESATGRSIFQMPREPKYETMSEIPGAPGMMTFWFEIVRSGNETLRLVYHRSWEEGVEPIDVFEVNVVAGELAALQASTGCHN